MYIFLELADETKHRQPLQIFLTRVECKIRESTAIIHFGVVSRIAYETTPLPFPIKCGQTFNTELYSANPLPTFPGELRFDFFQLGHRERRYPC